MTGGTRGSNFEVVGAGDDGEHTEDFELGQTLEDVLTGRILTEQVAPASSR